MDLPIGVFVNWMLRGETSAGIWKSHGVSTWHIPTILGPAAMAACGADNLDTLTGKAGTQLELMKDLWHENYLNWDYVTPAADGTYGEPKYFHGIFQVGWAFTLADALITPVTWPRSPI